MTNPTPDTIPSFDEAAAALAVLRRLPDINGTATLDGIARAIHPLRLLAADLLDWLSGEVPDSVMEMERELTERAASQGLHITTDPGEPIGYAVTENGNSELARHRIYQADELDDARALADRQSGIVVALLPEGGKA